MDSLIDGLKSLISIVGPIVAIVWTFGKLSARQDVSDERVKAIMTNHLPHIQASMERQEGSIQEIKETVIGIRAKLNL